MEAVEYIKNFDDQLKSDIMIPQEKQQWLKDHDESISKFFAEHLQAEELVISVEHLESKS